MCRETTHRWLRHCFCTMDSVWANLPSELSEHICNQLPKVRGIPVNLKRDIESQRWMLAKSFNYYLRMCQFHSLAGYTMFKNQLRVPNGVDINDYWKTISPDDRLRFYFTNNGPGTEWAREDLERQEMFREWREEQNEW